MRYDGILVNNVRKDILDSVNSHTGHQQQGGVYDYTFKNRVINVFNEFEPGQCDKIVEQLLKWEEEDAFILYNHSQMLQQLEDPTQLLKPIIININSPGGYLTNLVSIVDTLNSMQTKIITRAIGEACSCGFILFCMGDERYVGNNSDLMYHEIAYGKMGKHRDIEAYTKYNNKVQKRMDKLISTKTGVKMKTLAEWRKGPDKWMDAKEAVELGIATDFLY